MKKLWLLMIVAVAIIGCEKAKDNAATQETKKVLRQQEQYSIGQPVPAFDWSLERDLVISLYRIRNTEVATHSVWRSDHGVIEGDCPSMGYGIPYDVSLTNPMMATDEDQDGWNNNALTSIGQAEPNGIFASQNTSATWVMCVGKMGIEPHYVETKVTVYPGPVEVDYASNRVRRVGEPKVTVEVRR